MFADNRNEYEDQNSHSEYDDFDFANYKSNLDDFDFGDDGDD